MADSDGDNFYMLGDAALGALATAAPLRSVGQGRADIGGRLRVAAILRKAGLTDAESPQRIAGSTNEVWRAGDYVIRVGFVPGAQRLRREARLAEVLPAAVHYPRVVATGTETFGEWIIVRHRPGNVLSQDWPHLAPESRKAVVIEVAGALKAVHETAIDIERDTDLVFPEGVGSLALPHQLPAQRIFALLDDLNGRQYVDAGLIAAAEEKLREVETAYAPDEVHGLVHGDIHFENILSKDGFLVSLLDFEWSRVAPKEIDLDVLARFCAEPELHVGGTYSANAADYKSVLRWMCEGYPELFAHPRLRDRLMVCALALEVPSLRAMLPTEPASQLSPHHPINRLRSLLEKGTHAERVGWEDSPEPLW